MKTQVSELAENRVRLEIEVPAHDVDHAFDHALHDLSASVRVPGFRKGKAPAAMVARQIGREALVEEALRDHLTGWYSRAVAEIGIDPIDRPTIDWEDEPVEGAPFSFTAEVEVKPPPEVKKYKGLDGVRAADRGARRSGRRRDRASATERRRAQSGGAAGGRGRLRGDRLRGHDRRQAVRREFRHRLRRAAGRGAAGGRARAGHHRPQRRRRADDRADCPVRVGPGSDSQLRGRAEGRQGAGAARNSTTNWRPR